MFRLRPSILFDYFRRTKKNVLDASKPRINIWSAGLNYEERKHNAKKCKLGEVVVFSREPNNAFDPNAIHIKRQNGDSLGYVNKIGAISLRPLLESKAISKYAVITQLKCDLKKDIYGLRISLNVPGDDDSLTDIQGQIEYLVSTSEHNNKYLLLKCEDLLFDKVLSIFDRNEIAVEKTGTSHKPSHDGKQYDWYIQIGSSNELSQCEALLRQHFVSIKEKADLDFKNEYHALELEEIPKLQATKDKLIAESKEYEELFFVLDEQKIALEQRLLELDSKLEKTQRQLTKYEGLFEGVLHTIMPNIRFVGNSMELIKNELLDYRDAINKLYSVSSDPQKSGKPIKTLIKWYELHFNTGNKANGRIYFRRCNKETEVLVSLKTRQTKDIENLRRL